jgi:hypothetical protein
MVFNRFSPTGVAVENDRKTECNLHTALVGSGGQIDPIELGGLLHGSGMASQD